MMRPECPRLPGRLGLALVIGTVQSYMQAPKGSALLLGSGVILVVFAMIMSAWLTTTAASHRGWPIEGLIFAIVAGCLMGSSIRN